MARTQQSASRGQVRQNGQVLSFTEIAALIGESEGWRPEIGDEVQGTVLGVKITHSDVSDREYPIVFILRPDNNVTAIHCFQTTLFNEVVSQRPELGDLFYAKRLPDGEATRKGWNAPIRYAVGVQKPEGATASVWDRLGGPITAASEAAPEAPSGQFNDPMPE